MAVQRGRLISSATATAHSAASGSSRTPDPTTLRGLAVALNKTSTKPAPYGERFVKRRGLFCLALAPRHGVVSGCVSRQDNDRSAVHQLDKDRSRRRAGRSDAILGVGLVDFGPQRR